jgi:hypothetical protein
MTAVLLSEDGVTHFATLEVPHAIEGDIMGGAT